MQAKRDQSWRFHVTSKARNFNLKFRFRFTASSFTPTLTLSSYRLSIVLKLREYIFRISSQPTTQPKNGGGFIKAKVMNIVHKFQAPLAKSRPIIAAKREFHLLYPKSNIGVEFATRTFQDPIRIGFWLVGFLAFLAQSISNKDQKEIMMVASVGLFVASLLFNKFRPVKFMNIASFPLVVAAIICYLFSHFDNNYWNYLGWSWSAWNKIANL